MAFNPTSTIYLCNVDFDSTYKNIRDFASRTAQIEWFAGKVRKTLSDYTTVREALPDGGVRSKVRVDMNIDDLRALPCNYMYYQNPNHGPRYFFAFITDLIYKNEGTTEIVFETDVWQTWQFDIEFKHSYVEREHSVSDGYFENTVAESFNPSNYVYEQAASPPLGKWGYLVATSNRAGATDPDEDDDGATNTAANGREMSGIYQGLYFYFYWNEDDEVTIADNKINTLLDRFASSGIDAVQFISCMPVFNLGNMHVSTNYMNLLIGSYTPAEKTINIPDFIDRGRLVFGEYMPKNKKLFSYPYMCINVSNHNGEHGEYRLEDFSDPRNISFKMYGDISANPSVALIPENYKGMALDYDNGLTITGFPQCSVNTDTYKLWLAKNQFGTAVSTVSNLAQVAGGIAAISTGAGAVAGASMIASGVSGVLSTINSHKQASMEPNRVSMGGNRTNLLTAMQQNNFYILYKKIKENDARTIDDFFTMYGYQTNRMKVPNLSSRPYFNYVKTVDVNIIGAIPNDDMEAVKGIFNKGVTVWRSGATVGNYDVDNSPK